MQAMRRSRGALVMGWVFIAVLVAGLGWSAQAGQLLRVCAQGCDFADLREAVGKASDNSTIFVEPGEYAGPVIIAKNLAIIGSDRNRVVITGGVVVVGPFQITLRYLTITKGLHGVQAQAAPGLPSQFAPRLSLVAVTIAGNAANGVALFDAARASLCDVLITKNGLTVLGLPIGSGIALRGSSQIAVSLSLSGQSCGATSIRENGANGLSALDQATVRIGANTLIAKHSLSGVQLGGGSQGVIEGLIARENGCYGLAVEDNAQAIVTGGRLEQNGKAGLHIGGPSSTLPGCATQADSQVHASATVSGTVISQNPIGILVGDLSKNFESASATLIALTLLQNGRHLLIDPVAAKDVTVIGTIIK